MDGIRKSQAMMSKDDASSANGGSVSGSDESLAAHGCTGHRTRTARIAQRGRGGLKEHMLSLAVSEHSNDVQLCTRWFDLDGRDGVGPGEELGLVAPPQERAVPPVVRRNRAAHAASARAAVACGSL
jgi:hypothetical protein